LVVYWNTSLPPGVFTLQDRNREQQQAIHQLTDHQQQQQQQEQ
jgi:hypothetical protein